MLRACFIIYRQREIKERFAYIPGAEETSHHSDIIYFAILVAAEGWGCEEGSWSLQTVRNGAFYT